MEDEFYHFVVLLSFFDAFIQPRDGEDEDPIESVADETEDHKAHQAVSCWEKVVMPDHKLDLAYRVDQNTNKNEVGKNVKQPKSDQITGGGCSDMSPHRVGCNNHCGKDTEWDIDASQEVLGSFFIGIIFTISIV